MTNSRLDRQPALIRALGWYAIFGCLFFAGSIFLGDVMLPEHDWMADTVSDMAAGENGLIVDVGIFAYSASLLALALLAAHVHLGETRWSFGLVGLALLSLIVFLIGARNEYGDGDARGVEVHIYMVYALGVVQAVTPLLLGPGAGRAGRGYAVALYGAAGLWVLSAPIFFMLPTAYDGGFERTLGLISFAMTITLARLFLAEAKAPS